ncbi:hypothetical protein [Streptomyces sp. NPDC057694]|uniref:hypothetical protein n=1 Tax=Streptomyces sp. NPDC057694 TaxID=3346216 RepID=UPI0036C753F5
MAGRWGAATGLGDERHGHRRRWARGIVAGSASLAAVLALCGTATADPALVGGSAGQPRGSQLTSAEATALQNRVDGYIADVGGTQIAANRIRLGTGAVLTLALPSRADADRSDIAQAASYTCRYGHFCAYSDVNWSGDVIDMYYCADYKIPWFGNGSWINNQTPGTQAGFKDNDFVVRWADSGAYSSDDVADWSWVHTVKNC